MKGPEEVVRIFSESGALLGNGHFVTTAGMHTKQYVNKDALFANPRHASALGDLMMRRFVKDRPDFFIVPKSGAIAFAQWAAFYTTITYGMEPTLAVFADKDQAGEMIIRRGFDKLIKGKRGVILDDVLTTGGTVQKIMDKLSGLSEVIGIGVACDRSDSKVSTQGIGRIESLCHISIPTYSQEDCPMCKDGTPINTDFGKGHEFLMQNMVDME